MEETSQSGDMAAAVEAAFSASMPGAETASSTAQDTPASAPQTPAESAASGGGQPIDDENAPLVEGQPVPYQRFRKVNESDQNRKRELENLGWAKGVDPRLASSAIQLLTRAQGNPLAFTEELETLRDHPQFGPQLRSWAARMLGTRGGGATTTGESDGLDEPQPDLQLQDGTLVYSAPQLQKREQWLMHRIGAQMDERIAPLAKGQQANSAFVAEQVQASMQARAQTDGKAAIEALRSQFPQFDEHKPHVLAAMEQNPSWSLEQAWAHVFVSRVASSFAKQTAAATSAKARAGSINPQRPSGAQPQVPEGFKAHLEQLLS